MPFSHSLDEPIQRRNSVCMKLFCSGIIVQKNMLTTMRRSIEAETVKRHPVKLKGELIEFLDHDFMFKGKRKSNHTSVLSFWIITFKPLEERNTLATSYILNSCGQLDVSGLPNIFPYLVVMICISTTSLYT